MVVGENVVESVDTSGNWCLHVVTSGYGWFWGWY